MTRRLLNHKLFVLLSVCACAGCAQDRVVHQPGDSDTPDGCEEHEDCGDGYWCDQGECKDIAILTCGEDMLPLINVTPVNVELGEVPLNQTAEAKVTIGSMGNCLLTLQGANVKDGSAPGFSCSPCDFTSYPRFVIPQEEFEITVKYTAMSLGEALGNLVIRSDDLSAGPNGDVTVELHAAYSGKPVLVVDPPSLNFGYVPLGQSRSSTLRVMNKGTGNAALEIDFLTLMPAAGFSMPSQSQIRPQQPTRLAPYNANDPTTYVDVPITFSPTSNANTQTSLVIIAGEVGGGATTACDANGGCPAGYSCGANNTCVGDDFVVDISGSSLGPAKITVTPTELTFKSIGGDPLGIGMTAYQQVTIANPGESALELEVSLLADDNGEFSISPSYLAPIAPGASSAIGVFFAPTVPSDAASPGAPTVATKAVLQILAKNADPLMNTVQLNGWAAASLGDDVLRLDLTFDNANGGWANNDFRNVDVAIESPLGMPCTKPRAIWSPSGGTYVVTGSEDYCKAWNDTQVEGHVTWLAMGTSEEPERILLYGLGPDFLACTNGVGCHGDFKVSVTYAEDCANMPTGILSDLLGIGASALLGVLGGQVGVPINVPPDQISNLISSNCWDRRSTLATVQIYVNGQEVAAPAVRLSAKGDTAVVAHIQRKNGAFTVAP